MQTSPTAPAARTALHFACYKTFGEAGLVRLLLARPSSLTCLDSRDSITAIMAAVFSGIMDCFRELARLPGVNLETRNEQGLGLEEVARQRVGQEEVRIEVIWPGTRLQAWR